MTDRRNLDADLDIVSDIFETLRFKGIIFFHSELAAPWGFSFKPLNFPNSEQ